MKSPLVKFSCGCIGISLEQPSTHIDNATEVWLFSSCDGTYDGILGNIRSIENRKVRGAVPLTPEEFEKLRRKTQMQLSAGSSLFELLQSLDHGKDCHQRFREAGHISHDSSVNLPVPSETNDEGHQEG